MSQSGGKNNAVPATSAGEPTELQLTADRVASGLNLLRWALITIFAGTVVSFGATVLLVEVVNPGRVAWAWSRFALGAIGWAVAPLALIGILRILRARAWSVPRWLLISLVVYFAVKCLWKPLSSLESTVSWIRIGEGTIPLIDLASTIISWLIILLYLAVLFGGFYLARAVDVHFDGSLLSARHRRWLLWVGVAAHGVMLAWWAVRYVWGPVSRMTGDDDIEYGMVTLLLQTFLVTLPFAAWLIWLLVVALRIGRKLRRFAKRNRCPRCDYYLHDAPGRGCPECGWMRASESAAGRELL